jgi:hypothetical protein
VSDIRTIADIRQDEHSVQSIALRGLHEDVFTQTTIQVPRSVLINDLRNLARERSNNDDLRLPVRTNANGVPVGGAEDIRHLNETFDRETIRNILEPIAENLFSPEYA